MRVIVKNGAVSVLLARHERKTPATLIIAKLHKSQAAKDIVPDHGATVFYERFTGREELYKLRPDQFKQCTKGYTPGKALSFTI